MISTDKTRPRDKRGAITKIGLILAAHGIRGQVKIRSFTDNPEDIFSCPSLTDESGKRLFKLTHKGGTARGFIAAVEGITDRNEAELLKGTGLFAPASELPEKPADALVGLEVRLADGTHYGKVIGVYNFGAGDIVEIELANKKTEMLPLNDAFFRDFAAKKGYLVVYPPDFVEDNA